MTEAKPIGSTVVVAMSSAAREDYSIELAQELARSEAPELLGLFVEDAGLLEHAGSQQAREFLLTGEERALDRSVLEQQLRSQAAEARTRFEAATARLGLRHRFEVARGDVVAETVQRAKLAEALIVNLGQASGGSGIWPRGFARRFVELSPPRLLIAREGWLTGQSIAVVVDRIEPSGPVLDVASRVARRSGSPMTVLLASSGPDTVPDPSRFAHDVISVSGAGVGGIVLAMRACRPRLLVMSAPVREREFDVIDELMQRFSGALMLVRS